MPDKLTINLYLPSRGTVWIGALALAEHGPWTASQTSGGWWSERTGGLIGGIAGGLLGVLGGLAGSLGSRGKARGFVFGTMTALIALGAACLLAGVIALVLGQPRAVWLPLGLIGILTVSILPARFRQLREQYNNLELRRMAAIDAAG
jgi:hypothetical protein